jgi:hypothetical protein
VLVAKHLCVSHFSRHFALNSEMRHFVPALQREFLLSPTDIKPQQTSLPTSEPQLCPPQTRSVSVLVTLGILLESNGSSCSIYLLFLYVHHSFCLSFFLFICAYKAWVISPPSFCLLLANLPVLQSC